MALKIFVLAPLITGISWHKTNSETLTRQTMMAVWKPAIGWRLAPAYPLLAAPVKQWSWYMVPFLFVKLVKNCCK